MGEFLAVILGFPTVLFTVPLGLTLLYWLFVIVGAFDIHLFDSVSGAGDSAIHGVEGALHSTEGAVHAATEGAVHAATEGAVHAATEGAVHAATEGAVHAATEGAVHAATEGAVHASTEGALHGAAHAAHASEGALAMLANILRIGKVPITITVSLILLLGWLGSGIGSVLLASVTPAAGALSWLVRGGIGLAAFFGSTAFTSYFLRPFERRLGMKKAMGANDLVGKVATLITSSIDARFGQANLYWDDADLNVSVHYREKNELTKGAKLLLIGYDPDSNSYEVEPYLAILDELEAPHRGVDPHDHAASERAKARARAAAREDVKD